MAITEQFPADRKTTLKLKKKERRDNDIYSALNMIYDFTYSSSDIVNQIPQEETYNLSLTIDNYGLVKSTKTGCGSGFRNVPSKILTLTKEGVRVVESRRENLIKYEINPLKVRQDLLRHNHIVQSITIQLMNTGKIVKFETEREVAMLSTFEVKQPDVIWTMKNQQRIGVEVELTAKWGHEFDHQISSCVNSLRINEKGTSAVDGIIFYSDSPAIIKRYKQAYEPGKTYAKWEKNYHGKWVKEEEFIMPIWIKGKVICKLI